MTKPNRGVCVIAGIAGFIIVSLLINQVRRGQANRPLLLAQTLAQVSQELNTQLPKIIDAETRLDKLTAGPGNSAELPLHVG